MATRIQVRRDTVTNWSDSGSTVLASGEVALILANASPNKVVGCKVGDGATIFSSLEYAMPMMQSVPNVNRAGDTGDVTFLLKGLASQSVPVFALEETGAGTDRLLEVDEFGSVTIKNVGDNSTKLAVTATSGDIAVNTNKLTVAGATGNTTIAGTLDVTGETTTVNNSIVKGSTKFLKVQNVGGDDKFTVATDNGNITLASGATITGDITGVDATTLYAPADNAHGWAIDGASGGGGSVVQMQYKQWTTPQDADPGYSTYTGSWGTAADAAPIQVTPITITITPTSVNSIIVVEMAINGAWHYPFHCLPFLKRTDGGTSAVTVLSATGAGDRDHCIVQACGVHDSYYFGMLALKFFDRPASTSAITYDFWFSADSGYQSFFWINRKGLDDDTNHWHRTRCCSWMTATEIAAKA